MRILFTGGGTGGHIYPLISIIRELRRLYPQKKLELYYLGPKEEFSQSLLEYEDVEIRAITSGKIRRYFSLQNIIDILFKIPIGFFQSLFWLIAINPALILSKGGSGSISVTFSARLLRIPIFLHESDVVPGLSNRSAGKYAKKIFVSFPKTEYFDSKKTIVVGNPIRRELLDGDKEKATEILNLTLSRPIILVTGGSQGAEKINDFILLSLNNLLQNYEIIHVTGKSNFNNVVKEAEVVENQELEKYYHPVGYLDEEKLKHAYKAADLIISRSGSGSIFEIAATGKPSILVPLPSSAGDHQSKNAYAYSQTGAALVIEQENLTQNFFMENLQILFLHPEKLQQMSQAALNFAKPLAAKTIAREILEFLMLD